MSVSRRESFSGLKRTIHSLALIIVDAFGTLVRERRWRLLPAFVIFLFLSILLAFVKSIAPIAPFVYSLF